MTAAKIAEARAHVVETRAALARAVERRSLAFEAFQAGDDFDELADAASSLAAAEGGESRAQSAHSLALSDLLLAMIEPAPDREAAIGDVPCGVCDGAKTTVGQREVFSTGAAELDLALGVGGLPFGRIVEIYGPEESGKTTLAMRAIAEVQKLGRHAAFIDAEHALDPAYATRLGVDLDRLVISQPSSGEEALEIAEMLARSGEVGLIVVDSVAALTPRAELEGDMGDSHMGLQARLMGQALRKLTAASNQTGTCIIFINQLRQKIGVTFGSNETTTGGNALKFYASVRLEIRRIATFANGGARMHVKVAKNRMAPPYQTAEFDVMPGRA